MAKRPDAVGVGRALLSLLIEDARGKEIKNMSRLIARLVSMGYDADQSRDFLGSLRQRAQRKALVSYESGDAPGL